MYLYSTSISQHQQQGRHAILLSCIWVKCRIIDVSLLHSSPCDHLSAIATTTTVCLYPTTHISVDPPTTSCQYFNMFTEQKNFECPFGARNCLVVFTTKDYHKKCVNPRNYFRGGHGTIISVSIWRQSSWA